MRVYLRRALGALGLFLSVGALASQAGFRTTSVPGLGEAGAIPVALYYPTQAPERAIPMGLFTVNVAIGAAPEARVKGLILLSHGTGGSEIGHSSLAEALARDGYLVAALRHPGDNWQDLSLRTQGAERYFTVRPQQASRVIDALLQDPAWKDRIARDAQGPRVGAVGHSAGGYTVMALAGGQPEPARLGAHCASRQAEDPVLCSIGGRGASPADARAPEAVADARVRAVVALAPLGVVFTAPSLAAVRIPTAVYVAERDTYLVPRFHAGFIGAQVPGSEVHTLANANHWAFMDKPSAPVDTPDGNAQNDAPGFDRAAFLKQLGNEVPAFFDKVFP